MFVNVINNKKVEKKKKLESMQHGVKVAISICIRLENE